MKSPAGRHKYVAPAASDDDGSSYGVASVATLTKWLVPSITVLFAVIGYIVQIAQQDLLGLHYVAGEANAYVISAADFFRDVIGIPVTVVMRLLTGEQISLGGHGTELAVAALLFLTVLILPRLPRLRAMTWLGGSRHIAIVLVLILAGKFVLLDEPLFQVRNLILGEWVERPLGDDLGRTFVDRLAARGIGWSPSTERNGDGGSRAREIVASIVCSRVSQEAAHRDSQLGVHDLCVRDRAAYQQELNGRFVAQLWAAALIIALAIMLLRRRSRSQLPAALAVLALAYSLLVPYAYGKLQRSTFFDFGSVRLADPPRAPPSAAAVAPAGAQRASAPVLTDAQQVSAEPLQALTLSRTQAGTVLLVAVSGPCAGQSGQADASYSQVTLRFLSPSQVLEVDRIYRQDVIAWAALNERKCPPIEAPF